MTLCKSSKHFRCRITPGTENIFQGNENFHCKSTQAFLLSAIKVHRQWRQGKCKWKNLQNKKVIKKIKLCSNLRRLRDILPFILAEAVPFRFFHRIQRKCLKDSIVALFLSSFLCTKYIDVILSQPQRVARKPCIFNEINNLPERLDLKTYQLTPQIYPGWWEYSTRGWNWKTKYCRTS